MILSCNCRCLIDMPTRVTETSKTLIDHVITNDKQRTVTAEVSISVIIMEYLRKYRTMIFKIKLIVKYLSGLRSNLFQMIFCLP